MVGFSNKTVEKGDQSVRRLQNPHFVDLLHSFLMSHDDNFVNFFTPQAKILLNVGKRYRDIIY